MALKWRLLVKRPINTDQVLDVKTMLVLEIQIDGMLIKQDEVVKSYAQVLIQHSQSRTILPIAHT